MILVTGATGQLGTAVMQGLLKNTAASQLAAFVRDAAKAADLTARGVTIRVGTYDDTAALDRAMQGVDKVLLISGGDAENGLQQHQNVIDAARKAGVSCLAYTSRALKDRTSLANPLMQRHFQTEDYIRASGLPYVLFRNSLYMDAIPQFVGGNVFDTGIQLPAGQGKVAFALRSDMGEAMARVLVQADGTTPIYHFTGAEAYSFADAAAALTELSGKPVRYTPVERTVFEAQLQQRGLPDFLIQRIANFITDIKNGQESTVSDDLETVLGRKPTSLKEGLKLLYKL